MPRIASKAATPSNLSRITLRLDVRAAAGRSAATAISPAEAGLSVDISSLRLDTAQQARRFEDQDSNHDGDTDHGAHNRIENRRDEGVNKAQQNGG